MQLTDIFNHRQVVFDKLPAFGFQQLNHVYFYTTTIMAGQFKFTVTISPAGQVTTDLIDQETKLPYVLHTLAQPGAYAQKVFTACQEILVAINQQCFVADIFQSQQAKAVIAFLKAEHQDQPEFLWKKFPNNAIFRRQDTHKWYAAILIVAPEKLGRTGQQPLGVLDFRVASTELVSLIDNQHYYPGYHMNKQHWATICLDGSVPLAEIEERLTQSYLLAK